MSIQNWVRFCSGAGLILGLMLPTLSRADEAAYSWESPYVGVYGSYIKTDDVRGTDDGDGIKLFYGWNVRPHLNFEIMADFDNFETKALGTDFYRTSLGIDALYYFNPSGFSPFIVVGIGAAYNDVVPNSQDETRFFANGGLGLMSPPFTQYGIRARGDVRYVYDDFAGKPGDVHFNLGLVFPLLRPPRTVEVVRTQIKEVEVIKQVPVPAAPADSDRDGVVDGVDRCPNTLPGTEVDQYGCAKEKAVTRLDGVNFEFDSARLTPDSKPILDSAVDAMKGQPTMTVEVAGHCDATGTDRYNQKLSQRRAASVVNYLVDSGVERSRMSPVGYGESQPVATNETEEGRAQNRRVEFRVKTQ